VVLALGLLVGGLLTVIAFLLPMTGPVGGARQQEVARGLTRALVADLHTSSRDPAITHSRIFALPLDLLTTPSAHALRLSSAWDPVPEEAQAEFTVIITQVRLPGPESLLPVELLIETRNPTGSLHRQTVAISRPTPTP
jgi:hypothetical protein